ncbi:UPF0481 protein At3g47200-like isoform X2 [Gastrolobium bilobum]|uniref:UPF0481 protein At3g47200-like isoform X2 n=1 Tax=Gastrolobium bilobum TaxID=150636 RepID=UPI002AB11AD8|nr:UPF0481 protein At3g47200-like isoform X2 [Gastrolobium bilobum]XP_061370413.1 UPF0481 protein At3g47200-like isoform X2 [Gastrolobium bilobum]
MANQNRNRLAIHIEEILDKAISPLTTKCCIYRVPHEIRKLNIDAYTPKVVSIGPYHHDNPKLKNMEGHKLKYCKEFRERVQTSLDNLVTLVQELETEVRLYYSDNIELSSEELVKLILVDSCFIFELFFTSKSTDDDGIPFKGWLKSSVAFDLLLLENQLPFDVLDKLYNLASPSPNFPSFFDLTYYYFRKCDSPYGDSPPSIKHFTDMLRIFYLPPPPYRLPPREDELLAHLYSATELNEAGIKFRKGGSHLLDLSFSHSYLEIPNLNVGDDTEIFFRNMIALEQFHYLNESYITDYVRFLDYLINTSNDVDILIRKGIITCMLGDNNAVAELFNGLGKSIARRKFNSDYFGIAKELKAYYEHPWNNAKATLRRDYCRTPWKMAASLAAIGLLILTVTQTVLAWAIKGNRRARPSNV